METNISNTSKPSPLMEIRHPVVADGADVWQLAKDCEVLDTNSCYAYLLICRDFAETSLVAVSDGRLAGFVGGYVPPPEPDVIFVWQVGVAPHARKQGLGRRMLRELIARVEQARYLQANVTPSNAASRRLFESVAEDLNAAFHVEPGFSQTDFGDTQHEPEDLVRIGPLRERS